ncbi:MAG: AMP-binding protein [Bryobacteraceae bacterium]
MAAHGEKVWTYAALCGEVAARAERLRGNKSLVFCFCENDAETVFNYLAAVEAGHAVALVNAGLHVDLQQGLIERYQPDWILRGAEWIRKEQPSREIHPSLALLLATSGTTGSPKFVRLTRAAVEANAESIREALGIAAADRPITSLPLYYSYGLSVLNSHLAAGASLVLTGESVISPRFWEVFRGQACTSFAGVPYTYQMMTRLDVDKLAVPSLRTMTQAGGKLVPELIASFHEKMARRGGRFFVMYGQTEATARIAILPADELPRKLGSAGLGIPGGRISIDEGEVVYHGPNVMMGYAESPADLALGDELQGTLRTGDLGRLDDEGFLYIDGRAKRDVKLVGLRINLDEVEAMLRPHGATAVVSAGDKLAIYCEYGDAEQFGRLRNELATKLGLAVRLFEFHRVEKIPTTPTGKIDYARLKGAA